MKKKIKLRIDMSTCIDCLACIPEAWDHENDKEIIGENENRKVKIHGGTTDEKGDQVIELEVDEQTLSSLHSAIEVCPVDCIHIEEL